MYISFENLYTCEMSQRLNSPLQHSLSPQKCTLTSCKKNNVISPPGCHVRVKWVQIRQTKANTITPLLNYLNITFSKVIGWKTEKQQHINHHTFYFMGGTRKLYPLATWVNKWYVADLLPRSRNGLSLLEREKKEGNRIRPRGSCILIFESHWNCISFTYYSHKMSNNILQHLPLKSTGLQDSPQMSWMADPNLIDPLSFIYCIAFLEPWLQ